MLVPKLEDWGNDGLLLSNLKYLNNKSPRQNTQFIVFRTLSSEVIKKSGRESLKFKVEELLLEELKALKDARYVDLKCTKSCLLFIYLYTV